jgi:protein-S-isoprenylcysteine O-methyltransferase Ste14
MRQSVARHSILGQTEVEGASRPLRPPSAAITELAPKARIEPMSEDTAAPGAASRSVTQPTGYVPHPGVRVPAPLIHTVFLSIGLALRAHSRWTLMDQTVAMWIGCLIVTSVGTFSLVSAYQFARTGTSMLPFRPSRHLITDGPYEVSRNPIYLSLVLIHLGVGIWINSGWVVASALPCILILDRWMIVREEHYLRQRFGAEYHAYAARVRRWI